MTDQKPDLALLCAQHAKVPLPTPRSALGGDVQSCHRCMALLVSSSRRLPPYSSCAELVRSFQNQSAMTPVQFFICWWHGHVAKRLQCGECDVALHSALISFVDKAVRDGTCMQSRCAYALIVACEIMCHTNHRLRDEVCVQMLLF